MLIEKAASSVELEEIKEEMFSKTMPTPPHKERKGLTLYERVGGAPAIDALVEGMYAKIFYDPELEDFFRKSDKEHQKDMQRKFLTFLTGGSTEWHGKSMEHAHEERGMTHREFDRVAYYVVTTL